MSERQDTTTGLTATYGHGSITLTLYQGSGRVGVVQRGENAVMDVVDLLDFATDVAAVYGQDDSITELERKYAAALENEAYAAGIIELLRGMVDGEAFDVCEEFTEQRHSPVSPITTVRRERDEARMAASAEADHADELQARNAELARERDEARAEMERLTTIVRRQERYIEGLENVDAAGLKARAEKAEAALQRVEEFHHIDPWTEGLRVTRCICEETWPCSTITAIRDTTGETDG